MCASDVRKLARRESVLGRSSVILSLASVRSTSSHCVVIMTNRVLHRYKNADTSDFLSALATASKVKEKCKSSMEETEENNPLCSIFRFLR
jgi:hypothetical protein